MLRGVENGRFDFTIPLIHRWIRDFKPAIRNLDEFVGAGQAGNTFSLKNQVVSRLSRPLVGKTGRDGAEIRLHVLSGLDCTVPPVQSDHFIFRIAGWQTLAD
jgi:hypothetical protein